MNSAIAKQKPTTAGSIKQQAKTEKKPFLTIGPAAPKLLKKKEQLQLFRGIGSMLKAQINTADAVRFYAQGLPD